MPHPFGSAPMTDADAVLAANLDFYRAFGRSDYAEMDAIWARRVSVLCLHPGWTAIEGRDAVMESWRHILGDPDFHIMCHDERVHLYGDLAIVLCEEELAGGGLLAATNIFIREDGVWRMVHHQASAIIPSGRGGTPAQLH
jgi:ketosteroid isomerase-like protein